MDGHVPATAARLSSRFPHPTGGAAPSPGADRQRALKEIRAFALRQPLAGYGPALEASGHYNCRPGRIGRRGRRAGRGRPSGAPNEAKCALLRGIGTPGTAGAGSPRATYFWGHFLSEPRQARPCACQDLSGTLRPDGSDGACGQYLEKKTGRPTTGAVQLPAITPTQPFHAWAATPQPMVHF